MNFKQFPKSCIAAYIGYVALIILYAFFSDDMFRFTSNMFENTALYLCVFTFLCRPVSVFYVYRFKNTDDLIRHTVYERLRMVYILLFSIFLWKLLCFLFGGISFDVIYFGMYGILTLFSYTLLCMAYTLILLLPEAKLRLVYLYGFLGVTLALLFTGSIAASPLSPILFMICLSQWPLIWFILCVVLYGFFAWWLRKKIAKGDWS